MSLTFRHFGLVKKGNLIYYNTDLLQQSIKDLEGKEFELVLKEKYKKASEDAFGYYFGGIIQEALKYEIFGGWTKEEVDDFFSDMFLSYTKTLCIKPTNGFEEFKTIRKVESKSNLSSKRMKEFTEKVIVWLAENGIIVQSSENYLLGKYKTEYGKD